MRIASSLLLPALCGAASALESLAGHVFIYEPEDRRRALDDAIEDISPSQARTVLAQRAGVLEYHDADMTDKRTVEMMNTYGTQSRLFDKEPRRQQMIYVVEVDNEHLQKTDGFFDAGGPRFKITPPPSVDSTVGLLADILQQAHPAIALPNMPDGRPSLAYIDTTNGPISHLQHLTHDELLNLDLPEFNNDYNTPTASARDIVIITVSPTTPASPADFWGTYAMPNHPSYLHKREETPLAAKSTSTSSTTNLGLLASQSKPLKGILPTCFPSLSTCQSLTRNCTGHGSCGLKYTDASASDQSPGKHCYTCSCTASKEKVGSDGVKTTYWGGPACQKKDVSVQFWLIALFVVLMVGLVTFAVGTVWEMGSAELPSVIGAGVSGPTARH